ncbi:MAG: Spy/CpxP family protein refolding chaperone [Bacteroidales bacterium]|jgi:Spy/CpxP family protein refolding chaperone|nr:Spy/CpxP family protein refolding chaperone [Bacteroidales bacterium]
MKTQKISITMISLALLMFISSDMFAQRGNRNNNFDREPGTYCSNIPDLTPEQETKIEALRVDHLKKRTDYRNQMNELRAKKQTLMTTDKSDLNAINGIIDQMTGLQNKMMKEKAKHNQDIRSLLTDSQKIYFDNHSAMGKGNRSNGCMHSEMGQGNGRGMNKGNR